ADGHDAKSRAMLAALFPTGLKALPVYIDTDVGRKLRIRGVAARSCAAFRQRLAARDWRRARRRVRAPTPRRRSTMRRRSARRLPSSFVVKSTRELRGPFHNETIALQSGATAQLDKKLPSAEPYDCDVADAAVSRTRARS